MNWFITSLKAWSVVFSFTATFVFLGTNIIPLRAWSEPSNSKTKPPTTKSLSLLKLPSFVGHEHPIQQKGLKDKNKQQKATTHKNIQQKTIYKPGLLPAVAALVPGFLIHGGGHWIAGDGKTAVRLLKLEGIGLVVLGASLTTIILTKASRRLIGIVYPLALSGFGVFTNTWLADIYGAMGASRIMGSPRRRTPRIEADLGYAYIYDPQFAYSSFLVSKVNLRAGAFRFSTDIWMALDDDNQRYRFEGAYRFFGPQINTRPSRDGTFLDLLTAMTYHRFGTDGFKVITWEVFINGRYDMGRIGESLKGSFAELGLGWGLENYGYPVANLEFGSDIAELLLMRFGFGVYLGQPSRRFGELMLFYDHRHDDWAAGSSHFRRIDGVLGHLGLKGFYYLTRRFGVTLELNLGSAFVAQIGCRYQYGGRR